MSMTGYMEVSKAEAKRMIDEAPGDKVVVSIYNCKTRIHMPTSRKSKKTGKDIVEIAKEIGFQDNDIFGVIGCRTLEDEIKSIFLPRFLE